MGSILNLLYDYTRDFECLITKADELVKKRCLKDELSKYYEIKGLRMEDLSIRDVEYLVSLSRILVNYGYSHTYESFENACLLLIRWGWIRI